MKKPNIYLEAINGGYKMHLPCEKTLELREVPPIGTSDGIVIDWPLNPHFTGFYGIASMLGEMSQFKGMEFVKGDNC